MKFTKIRIDDDIIIDFLRIGRYRTERPGSKLIEYAYYSGYLYDEREYLYLQDIMYQRYLNKNQEHWLKLINRRIVECIVVNENPR